jgi:hypothetical protein
MMATKFRFQLTALRIIPLNQENRSEHDFESRIGTIQLRLEALAGREWGELRLQTVQVSAQVRTPKLKAL